MGLASYIFRISTILALFLSIAGCESSKNPNRSPETEVETLNLFFADSTIYSYDEEKKQRIVMDTYNDDSAGSQTLLLNTNEEVQGYEYLAFAKGNDVYLLNAETGKKQNIVSLTGDICEITKQPGSGGEDFFGNSDSFVQMRFDTPTFFIRTNTIGNCDTSTDIYYHVAFEAVEDGDSTTLNFQYTEVDESYTNMTTLIDYLFESEDDDFFERTKGRHAFAGHNATANQLEIYDNQQQLLDALSTSDVTGQISVTQVTPLEVLIRFGDNVYVREIANMINVAQTSEIDAIPEELPSQSTLSSLFGNESLVLTETDANDPIKVSASSNSFLLEDGEELYYFADNQLKSASSVNPIADPSVLDIDFYITPETNVVLLHKIYADTQILSRRDPETQVEITLVQADEIEFLYEDDTLFINTLNVSGSTGWDAHWYEKTFSRLTTYSNSRFLFLDDPNSTFSYIALQSTDSEIATDPMVDASIYYFDPTETNGRQRLRNSDSDKVLRDEEGNVIEAIIGEVEDGTSVDVQQSGVLNDSFGRLVFVAGDSTTYQYFFDPSPRMKLLPNSKDRDLRDFDSGFDLVVSH